MPAFEAAAEAIGSAFFELLYWGSIRPRGACAIAATCLAIAFSVRVGLPVGWGAGVAMTLAATGAGYTVGLGLGRLFSDNRPARIVTCVLALCVTVGSFAWLIFGG